MPENTNPTHLDLFSGIQSEGSHLPHNGQDSEPLPSVKKMNGVIECSKKTLEKHRFLVTLNG